MSGRKHSDKTKIIMSDAKKGENHPMYGKNHSNETKKIMSDTKKGKPKTEGSGKPSQQIEVTDSELNITTNYNSMSEAARVLNLPSHITISDFIKNNQGEAGVAQKPYKGQYTFKKL